MRTLTFLLISCLQLASVAGHAAAHAERVAPGKYRSTVALVYRASPLGDGEIFCSGTIVETGTVLTAAHCLVKAAEHYRVALPELIRRVSLFVGDSPDEKKIPAVKPTVPLSGAVIRPDYADNQHDLAVLAFRPELVPADVKLETAVVGADAKFPERTPVTSVGFGIVHDGGPKGAKTKFTRPARWLSADWFHVGEKDTEGPSICHGDSGGSAFATNKAGQTILVGVATSTSVGHCGNGISYYQAMTADVVRWVHSAAAGLVAVR